MKIVIALLGVGICTTAFSYGTTYTRDITPFTVGFENKAGNQIARIYIRNIGNRKWKTTRKVTIKLNKVEYSSQVRKFPEGILPNSDKAALGYGGVGFYEVSVKGKKLNHCQLNKVHIEIENSFQRGKGTADNDLRELGSFEMGNNSNCPNLPVALRRPDGMGIFNQGEM
jgi:hypothetical protein